MGVGQGPPNTTESKKYEINEVLAEHSYVTSKKIIIFHNQMCSFEELTVFKSMNLKI